MKNFASFEGFDITDDQAVSIEGGESDVRPEPTVFLLDGLSDKDQQKVLGFMSKIRAAKASTTLSLDQKIRLELAVVARVQSFIAQRTKIV